MGRFSGIVFFLAIFGSLVAKSEQFTITDEHLNPKHYTPKLANFIVHRMAAELRQKLLIQPDQNSERVGIIPPELIELLPDIPIDEGRLDFDNVLLKGAYEYNETNLEGLNTLWDDFLYGTDPLFFAYAIGFLDLGIRGNYNLDVNINITYIQELYPELFPSDDDVPEEAPLRGNGNYELALKEFYLNVSLTFDEVDGKIDSVSSGLKFGLDALSIYFQDLEFNEVTPFEPLLEFISGLLPDVVLELLAGVSESLTGILDLILSDVFKGCVVQDLINGDFLCVLIPEPTTTTTRATTTTTASPGPGPDTTTSTTTAAPNPTSTTTSAPNPTSTTESGTSHIFIQSTMIFTIASVLAMLY